MNTQGSAPVPIPWPRRLAALRVRFLPGVIFAAAVLALAFLWRGQVAPIVIPGQAEPVVSEVSCFKAGVLAELNVSRFQRVRRGDTLGKVMVADPRILASSLAVIQAEIDALRASQRPVITQQRNAMDYQQLRLDWMRQRTQLAAARVSLGLAESEYQRMEQLFKEQIVSQRDCEQAKANRDRFDQEVTELSRLVEEGEHGFQQIQRTNVAPITPDSPDPMTAAIAVQESKLRLTEAELSPLLVKAPIDGVVSTIFHRAGEAVTPGQPILSLATLNPVRIVGYVRAPLVIEPKVGMSVEVRARGRSRQRAQATVTAVGSQLEPVPPTLLGPINFANIVQGLPIDISLPPDLRILPGEVVDIELRSGRN